MAGPIWLKLAGLVGGNSVTDMGKVRGGMIHDSRVLNLDSLCRFQETEVLWLLGADKRMFISRLEV